MSTLVAAGLPASAAEKSAQEQRREVQRKRAQVAAEVDTLRASDAEVERALQDLQIDIDASQQEAAEARAAADAAAAFQEQARADEAAMHQRIDTLRGQLRDVAIASYIGGGNDRAIESDSDDAADKRRREVLVGYVAGNVDDMLDQLRLAEEDLADRRDKAESAAHEARARLEAAQQQLAEVDQALSRQQAFADGVQKRLDHALSEAASLASLDKQLADQIARQQAAIARQTPATRSTGPTSASSGGGRRVGQVQTTVVGGIEVNVQIASNLEALLAAAAADGLTLGGGGFRDPSAQIATRRNNCGTSDYAIYDMPASQCSPPTARPGSSMHEQGLAIDFTSNGAVVTKGSAAFAWLSRNAGRFGFRNLAGEPWHWSTNGD